MSVRLQTVVPEDLAEWVQEQAAGEKRSVASWIKNLIEDKLADARREAVSTVDIAREFYARYGVELIVPPEPGAPIPCTCGGVIYQVGSKKGQCSKCTKPRPA